MQTRTRLRDVKLVGARAWLRQLWFGATIALSAIGAVGYLLPSHESGGVWHSNYADGGPIPLLVFVALGVIALLLRKRGLGAGIAMSVLSTAGAIASVVPILLVHLFSGVQQSGIGESVLATGVIGLFFGGLFALVEPVLYLTQRRADERVELIPVARIHH